MAIVPPRDLDYNTPQTTFIYILIDPETNEVRYVGKSNNPKQRLTEHLRSKSDTHKNHWIQSLKKRNLKPLMQIIEETSFDQWKERECYWIEYYHLQGYPLTNIAPGGIGSNPAPETRAKLAASKRGRPSPTKGVKRGPSPLKGIKRPPYSPEWCANIAAGLRGTKHTPEARANMGNSRRGKKRPPEVIAKGAAKRRGRKLSTEHKKNLSLAWERRRANMRKLPPDAPTLWD